MRGKPKSIGIVGLGKMGKNIALRLLSKGYDVVAYNRSAEPIEDVEKKGAIGARSMGELVKKLKGKKTIWLMLPAGEATDQAVDKLADLLEDGDTIIDGSNSKYKDAIKHHEKLKKGGIRYLDSGSSGGPSGALKGMSIMVGGDKEVFKEFEYLFEDLSVPEGYAYMGPCGSGHFVKMVHNAIEYGMMQSIAEGLDLIANGPYKDLDLEEICHVWNNGSVVRSYLVELSEKMFSRDQKLSSVEPYVEDTGEGRWAAETAIEYAVPFTTLSHAVYERFSSRSGKFPYKYLSALRHEFGGHEVKKKKGN